MAGPAGFGGMLKDAHVEKDARTDVFGEALSVPIGADDTEGLSRHLQ